MAENDDETETENKTESENKNENDNGNENKKENEKYNEKKKENENENDSTTHSPALIQSTKTLLSHGILLLPIPPLPHPLSHYAQTYSQITPLNLFIEGESSYAFYNNIYDCPDFPFDILQRELLQRALPYFGIQTLEDIELHDAFCIRYDTSQDDTTCGKHTDPSDVTVNLCLEWKDGEGSEVEFFGRKSLVLGIEEQEHHLGGGGEGEEGRGEGSILVRPREGYATIHWGDHPHRTLALTRGRRTNIVMTYCFKDEHRSKAMSNECFVTGS